MEIRNFQYRDFTTLNKTVAKAKKERQKTIIKNILM